MPSPSHTWIFVLLLLLSGAIIHNNHDSNNNQRISTLFSSSGLLVSGTSLNQVEFNALYELYNATNGDSWIWPDDDVIQGAMRWDFSHPEVNNPCTKLWYGATCYFSDCQPDGTGCNIFTLDLNSMNLNGTLPASISKLSKLILANLGGNHLYGDLPIFNATTLNLLNISHNQFTGTIPETLVVNPLSLQQLYVSHNNFNGSIPDVIYSMKNAHYLSLSNNAFTGTISDRIGDLSDLTYLSVGSNFFNGTVPNSLMQLQRLEILYLNNNSFTGSFLLSTIDSPVSTSAVTPVVTLIGIDESFIFSSPQSTLLSSSSSLSAYDFLPELRFLWIADNDFVGSFPSHFCQCTNLSYISIYNNRFTGTLPTCLNQLLHLEVLQVQQNKLHGDNLNELFQNSLQQTQLQYIDLSDNAFSGDFPENIFRLPSLKTIAAVKNCFEGTLPPSICESSPYLSIIALDGMRASSECLHYLWDPLGVTTGYYSDLMRGDIPSCIWTLPNISVLHLSGNGFAGSIPKGVIQNSTSIKLRDVALNHNTLRGKVPEEFQQIPFRNLDLSYNKLLGSIESVNRMPFRFEGVDDDSNNNGESSQGAQLKLYQNRFSGKLPSILEHAYDVNVLDGNVFTCAKDPLPEQDPHYDTYVCGSQDYDQAAAVFSTVLAISVFSLIILLFFINSYDPDHGFDKIVKSVIAVRYALQFSRSLFNFDRLLKTQGLDFDDFAVTSSDGPTTLRRSSLLSFRLSEEIHQLKIDMDSLGRYRNVYKFLSILSLMRATCLWVAAYAIIFCLPVYIGFYTADPNNPALYSTHDQRYAWITTSAYLTGSTPAMVLLALWVVILMIVVSRIVWHFNIHNRQTTLLMEIVEWFKGLCSNKTNRESSSPLEDSLLLLEEMSDEGSATDVAKPRKSEKGKAILLEKQTKKKGKGKQDVEMSPASSNTSSIDRMNDEGDNDDTRRSSFMLTLPKIRLCYCDIKYWSIYVIIVIINIIVCISVNIAYLHSQNDDQYSSQAKNALQFLMAGFKVAWGMIAVRSMISYLPFNKNSTALHVMMLLWNGIIAPCLATAFTDQSCFDDFFRGCEQVVSTYSVPICQSFYEAFDMKTYQFSTGCEIYSNVAFTTTYTPAFIYYYACGAKLLSLYVPVYIYIYTILFVSVPLSLCIQAKVRRRWLPKSLRYFMIKGILRPAAAYRDDLMGGKRKEYSMLIRGDSIQVLQINHLVILMTFGLTSPILAVIMALAIIADTFAWQLVIIRFFKYGDPTSPFSRQSDELLKKQQLHQQIPIQEQYGPAGGRLTTVGRIPSPMVVTGHHGSGSESSSNISKEERFSDSERGSDTNAKLDDNDDDYDEGDEDERLSALDTGIADTWVCLKNNKWVILYCSMCFYAFILFDMVGDEGGWRHAMFLVLVVLILMFLMRLFLLDIAIWMFQTLLRYTRIPRHSILSSWSVGSIE